MKAFIFNSGIGKRMGELTEQSPKALIRMSSGETILGRQIRILRDCGIKEFVITTGPFPEKIENFVNTIKDIKVTLVHSDKYSETNSIYSMFVARNVFDDDFVILHGDLVFDEKIASEIIKNKDDVVLINKLIRKPEKDFKGRIVNEFLKEISVNIFDDNCYALQPFYKLSLPTIKLWLKEVENFVGNGDLNVYAENALNKILDQNPIKAIDYHSFFIDEIDNIDDFNRVSILIREHDYKNQEIKFAKEYKRSVVEFLEKFNLKKPFLVYSDHLANDKRFADLVKTISPVLFSKYSPNPKFEEVIEGHKLFVKKKCDSIIAIGGGSTIDVAKAIKLYSHQPIGLDAKEMPGEYVDLKFVALPTTAGTGSESTRFAVVYRDGIKTSLTNDSLIPNLVILSTDFLNDLPIYQRKSTLLDALCQAIEGYWSTNSTKISRRYSSASIHLILKYFKPYVDGGNKNLKHIFKASNYAGKSINIAQTTAPHAMSYMITKLMGCSHGHAVSLTLPYVYEHMANFTSRNNDKILKNTFNKLAKIFGLENYRQLTNYLLKLFKGFKMEIPSVKESDLDYLVLTTNVDRLKNNPVSLDVETIRKIYTSAFKNELK